MMRIAKLLAMRMLDHEDSIAPKAPSVGSLSVERLKGISNTLRTLAVCGLSICFLGPASSAHAANAEDSYAQSVFKLVKAHEDGLPRLTAPAEGTAKALIAGGSFYLGGDPGWIAEGDGRAGGLTMARPLPLGTPAPSTKAQPSAPEPGTWLSASTLPVKGDVVWIAYLPAEYAQDAAVAAELDSRGCFVVLFGPKLADGPPHASHWIDSLTSATDDANLTRMGNIISLWTLTAELTAATSRQGKTLSFYESDSIEGARVRNGLYGKLSFHDGVPSMSPTAAGTLSRDYMRFIQTMLHEINTQERSKIDQAALELKNQAAAGHPAILMLVGHMLPSAVDQHSSLFRYMSYPAERNDLQKNLPQNGYFVFIGYVGIYLDLWKEVREDNAKALWVASPLPTAVDFNQWHDVVLDEHWEIGDSAVTAPGYDVKILPPSGIAQLFIYEMLMHAAGK
jgi:hypothetical protein